MQTGNMKQQKSVMKPMRMMTTALVCLVCLLSFGVTAGATASDPRAVMEEALGEIMAVLLDPASQDETLWPEKRLKVVRLIEQRFDFEEMSKRCLAKEWRRRNQQEKDHFITIFKELLQNTYIDRLKNVSDEEIRFEKVQIKRSKAVVKTIVVHNRQEYSFIYKLINKNDHWFVYDVIIEGVSLIRNYRSQFAQVITKDGFPGLVARIEEKLRPAADEEYAN